MEEDIKVLEETRKPLKVCIGRRNYGKTCEIKTFIEEDYIPKSLVREKIEERYGILCMELGSYVRDEATPEQERIAGGINELRKLKKELLQEGDDK